MSARYNHDAPCGDEDDGDILGPDYDVYKARETIESLPAEAFRLRGVREEAQALLEVLEARMKATCS